MSEFSIDREAILQARTNVGRFAVLLRMDGADEAANDLDRIIVDSLFKEKKIADLEAQVEKLRASLVKYGHHLGGCNYYKSIPYSDKARFGWRHCTCGYEAAQHQESDG